MAAAAGDLKRSPGCALRFRGFLAPSIRNSSAYPGEEALRLISYLENDDT
jgi:hypothetical protein